MIVFDFLIVEPQGITPLGNTETIEILQTADCIAITSSEEGSVVPSVIFNVPEVYSITSSETSAVDIYGYGVREAYSITSACQTTLDLSIDSSRLVYFDSVYE
jgi:hypothetical protein